MRNSRCAIEIAPSRYWRNRAALAASISPVTRTVKTPSSSAIMPPHCEATIPASSYREQRGRRGLGREGRSAGFWAAIPPLRRVLMRASFDQRGRARPTPWMSAAGGYGRAGRLPEGVPWGSALSAIFLERVALETRRREPAPALGGKYLRHVRAPL